MKRIYVALMALVCGLCAAQLLADTLTMKDGTKVEGRVIPQGERYWVKLPDGSTKYVDKAQVTSLTKGDVAVPSAPAVATGAGATTKPSTPAGSASFASVKSKAALVE